jgi:FlaA1/EpsC-like NDP-sugar epimerase
MIFALVDGLLIVMGFIIGCFVRFGGKGGGFYYLDSRVDHLVGKMIIFVAVIQISYYYFNLYEFKNLRERIRVGILLLEALGVSSILLALIYYGIPSLAIGRGIFFLSVVIIFILNFGWRLFYPWVASQAIFKERVLIVGTGELAQKILEEIRENGQGAFEIVGFVDEQRERIGECLGSSDYRGFQPNLFHLQRRKN